MLPKSPSKDSSVLSGFPPPLGQIQSCRRPLGPRPLPEILPMRAAERWNMGHGANGQKMRAALPLAL